MAKVKTAKARLPKPKPAAPLRGARRMVQLGHTSVNLWFSELELQQIRDASEMVGKPIATYVRERALACAQGELNAELVEKGKQKQEGAN